MRATTSYLILATPRSGSSLLGRALTATNLAGQPREYFGPRMEYWWQRWKVSHPAAFVDRLLAERTTANGVFGAKVLWRQLVSFERVCRAVPEYQTVPLPDLMSGLFPDLRYVHLTRRDKLRQAISYWKALESGLWSQRGGNDGVPLKTPTFDYDGITKLLNRLETDEAGIERFFAAANLRPFPVVYEDFVDAYEATVRALLAYLGVTPGADLVVAGPQTVRQADDETERWIERYHAIRQAQPPRRPATDP